MPATWRIIGIGPTLEGLTAVAPDGAAVQSCGLDADLVVHRADVEPSVLAAARQRWPRAWLVGAERGPAVDAGDALDLLTGARQAGVAFTADGQVCGETPAFRAMVAPAHAQAPLTPSAVVADAGDMLPGIDLGNRMHGARGPRPVQVRGMLLSGEPGQLLLTVEPWLRPGEWIPSFHQALIENAQDLVAIVDERGVVRYQSPASTSVLGFAPEAMTGKPLDLPFAEDRSHAANAFRRVRAAPGSSERVLVRMRHANDSLRWIEAVMSNQLDRPSVKGIVVNARDITEQREMERSLRDSERVRVAGLLASTIAHDLNNMLSVMMINLDDIEEMVGGVEGVKTRAASTRGAVERASELARRLLAFGRRRVETPERVDLGRLVVDLAPIIQPVVQRGHKLIVHVDEGSHPVRVVPAHLEQAVVNLIVNARDAMGPEGTVQLRVERRPGGARPEVALVVQDDGPGMPPDVAAQAFDPYFTTKGPERGTGLGLLVVGNLARDADGRVSLQSEEGAGTRIEIVLPIDLNPRLPDDDTLIGA